MGGLRNGTKPQIQHDGDDAGQHLLRDSEFFKAERTKSITLHGSLYLTLFGNPQSQTLVLTHKPANVGNGIQCSLNEIGQLVCRSAFRWPRLFVYAKVRNDIESLWPMISYSPFPAG